MAIIESKLIGVASNLNPVAVRIEKTDRAVAGDFQNLRAANDGDFSTLERRIEVIDFFWYGCPHCNELQPALEGWLKRKPSDVTLRRIPAILRDTWAPHARIFYALELLNEVERLHLKVYHSYHVEELHMAKPDVMEQWAVKNGIERRKWVDAYFSPEVDGSLARAKRATQVYTVEGTPSLVVDGRYITSGSMAPSLKGMIPVLEDLIQIARQRRALK